MIRAFIAITIERETIESIVQAMTEFARQLPGLKCVAKENLHLTLKFLGDIDPALIGPIGSALERALRPFPRFTINAKGLGVFPNPRRPQVLWVGFASDDLVALAGRVESTLKPLGFAVEAREFKPHLTVGRWRRFEGSVARFREQIEKWHGHEFGRSKVDAVTLFESVLKPEGAIYRSLKSVALAG